MHPYKAESGMPFLVNAIPEIVRMNYKIPRTRSRPHRRTLGNSYQLFLNLREKASKRRHSAIADTGRSGENECWGRPSSLNSDFGYFLSVHCRLQRWFRLCKTIIITLAQTVACP